MLYFILFFMSRFSQMVSSPASNQGKFAHIPRLTKPRSAFRRPFTHKTTFNAGYLVPVLLDEILPGDTYIAKVSAIARLQTMIRPIMDNLTMSLEAWFVPSRLVWDNWQKFMGEQDNPTDSIDYTIPQVEVNPVVDDLGEHFALPIGVTQSVNALPFRAYNLIWNEWYRDQNLQDSLVVQTDDGPDTYANYNLVKRAKRYDYFTSCLPFPQKGPAVDLPLGGYANVVSDVVNGGAGVPNYAYQYGGGTMTSPLAVSYTINTVGLPFWALGGNTDTSSPAGNIPDSVTQSASWHNTPGSSAGTGLLADLSTATSPTINDFRIAMQLQYFYELNARGGTRYTEILYSHFGVISPDARLQRPEFLGSVSSPVAVNPLQQTSASVSGSPQGNLSANGTVAIGNKHLFHKAFVEHGYLIVLASIRSYQTYQQGTNRLWLRQTNVDFYWPAFAHLGEQEVFNTEIYSQGTSQDMEVFGYQERYAEYRYLPSVVTGYLNSSAPDSLDDYTLAPDFTSLPTLSATFIEENPPISRVIADSDNVSSQFIADFQFDVVSVRRMPTYGVPASLIGSKAF